MDRQVSEEILRRQLLNIIAAWRQFITDVEWWNNNRTDAPPMDCEPERIGLRAAQRCLEALDSGNMEACVRLSVEMLQASASALLE